MNPIRALKPLRVVRLGLMPWKDALDVQNKFVQHLRENPKASDVLLLCEHPPVYTLGKRLEENPQEAARLRAMGAEYFKTSRGGQITFHGPGQLVGYPIVNLRRFNPSIRVFVQQLEDSLINSIAHWNLKGEHSVHTGVWVNDNKIAALGLQVSNGITLHGFALNCNVDLKWFRAIVACGIQDKGVTSISAECGGNVPVSEAIPVVVNQFASMFACEPTEEIYDPTHTWGVETVPQHPSS